MDCRGGAAEPFARRLAGALAPVAAAVALSAFAQPAAGFGIQEGDGGFRGSVFSSDLEDETRSFTVDGIGIYDQAGGHPFKGITDFFLTGTTADNVDNLRVDIPPGLVPNPNGFATCSELQLAASLCPVAAQIGTEELTASLAGITIDLRIPLYNIEPRPDDVARFGFNPLDAAVIPGIGAIADALAVLHPVHIVGGVRDAAAEANPPGSDPLALPADNGLFFTISDIPEALAVLRSKLTFWGTPGAPAHDSQRRQSCVQRPLPLELCFPLTGSASPAEDLDIPFLSNPTRCTGAKLSARLIVNSHGGATANRLDQTPTLPNSDGVPSEGAQECDLVPTRGEIEIEADGTRPDTPTGPLVRLRVPQPGLTDDTVLATSHVRHLGVTLPEGMTLNPSVGNGLAACSDGQLAANAGVPGGEQCPPASQVGDVTVSSPLLPAPLGGRAYAGQPLPGDRYRLFVTIAGRGVSIRLKGTVTPDPGSGRLTATFRENPELPFDRFDIDLRGGPAAPLATPLDCSPHAASATFTPWSGNSPLVAPSAPLAMTGPGCPAGFEPGFSARSGSARSGALAPLEIGLTRPDGQQFLAGVVVSTPPGLAAMISRAAQCPDAAAARGDCPAASRIGTARTLAGAGPQPLALSGPVYLTGPYKGAPFGMVVAIRAIAGPYDLGTVVVRQAIFASPETLALTVVSDPLPRILEGVPIRLRAIDVALDRPGFVYNPTSCGTKPVGAKLSSTAGAVTAPARALSFSGCEALPFTPRLSLRLTGPGQTRRGGHPGLRARVTQARGEAGIARARVTLPRSLALDPSNARSICGVEAGLRARCPASTRIGTATAVSPALNRPLRGPVYFVQGVRTDPVTGSRIRTLPGLLAKLDGELRVDLRGSTAVEGGRLVSTFDAVPDAPIARFDLQLRGGRGGVLAATGRPRICAARTVASGELTAHSRKVAPLRVRIDKPCRAPRLRIRGVARKRAALVVRGTIAQGARGRLATRLRCAGRQASRKARRTGRGRWRTTIALRGRCATVRRARLAVDYAGGAGYRPAAARRSIRLATLD